MNHHDVPPERQSALVLIRERNPGESGRAQSGRLLVAMEEMGHVSTFEASRFLDVYHPPARKRDLVQAGHLIVTVWRYVFTEAGRRHRVGLYSLIKGATKPGCVAPKETAPNATNALEAGKSKHVDSAALVDFSPAAAVAVLQQSGMNVQAALGRLGIGDASMALQYAIAAHSAAGAAVDSLRMLLGG